MLTKKWQLIPYRLWLLLVTISVLTSVIVIADEQVPGLVVQAIPSAAGYEAWVWANVVGSVGRPVSGILCDSLCGPCQAMTCTASGCGASLSCLPGRTTVEGQMSVKVTLSPTQILESGPLPFIRAFVRASQSANLVSPDNLLNLTIFPNSLPADTYIIILATAALPGVLPPAHRLIGQPYGVRASGALVLSDSPMSLHLAYDRLWLTNTAPHNLSIFAWDPTNQTWLEKGGILFNDQNYLAIPIQRFTTYALVEVPAWRDTFADTSGLSLVNSVRPTPGSGLILNNNTFSGTAISIPITPTTTISGWNDIVFTATTPAMTSMTVDILSSDSSPLLTNVNSGTSLAGLDPDQYPALRLRVNLASTVAGRTPALAEWRLSWQATKEHTVYLPVVLK